MGVRHDTLLRVIQATSLYCQPYVLMAGHNMFGVKRVPVLIPGYPAMVNGGPSRWSAPVGISHSYSARAHDHAGAEAYAISTLKRRWTSVIE